MAQLTSIVYKPIGAEPVTEAYTRLPLSEAELVVGQGIQGDAKGNGNRQLNVMTAETLAELGEEGFTTAPGKMGEQLMISGLDVDALMAGDQIQIGDSAVIEKLEPRTGCAKFERYQGKMRTEAAGRLGIMARVVTGGRIHVGDDVRVV